MICQSSEYKHVLCSFASQYVPSSSLLPNTWNFCEKIMYILQVFNDATYFFSYLYKPTSHEFLKQALNITGAFNEGEKIDEIRGAILEIKQKWLNYYMIIPDIYLVAFIFYPRLTNKFESLSDILEHYYSLLHLEIKDILDVSFMVTRVRRLINELLMHFSPSVPITDSSSTLPPTHSSQPNRLRLGSQFIADRRKKSRTTTSSATSEFEIYLTNSFEVSDDFQILDWWKQYHVSFPTLAKVALQVLAVPASTVAVEQLFSKGGNILDEKRSRMKASSLEAQVCVDDWSRAIDLTQELLSLHLSSSENEETEIGNTSSPTTDLE